jgi:tRNA threonylcarbamoyladenosine modification (KEOPS) complex Cgi121 subunit
LVFLKLANKYVYFHTVFFTQYNDLLIIDKLRKEFPDSFIQALNVDIIYNYKHLFEVLQISNLAQIRNIMCSNKIELDFLLRVMGTNQISQAIKDGGLKIDQHITFVILGKKYEVNRISQKLISLFGNSHDEFLTDKMILSKKIEIYKIKYNNEFINEENTIKYLTEKAALVMK